MNNSNLKSYRNSPSSLQRIANTQKYLVLVQPASKNKKLKQNKAKKSRDDPYYVGSALNQRLNKRNLSKPKKGTTEMFKQQNESSFKEASAIKDIVKTSVDYTTVLNNQNQPETSQKAESPQICKVYYEKEYEERDVYLTPPRRCNITPKVDLLNPQMQYLTAHSLDAFRLKDRHYLTGKQKRRLQKLKSLERAISSNNLSLLPAFRRFMQNMD